MKKSILIALAGVAAAFCAFGQGTVNFRNDYKVGGTGPFAYIFAPDGTTQLSKDVGRVEILDNLGHVISTSVDGKGTAFIANGLFLAGTVTVPGTSAIIRCWDSSTGLTYADATTKMLHEVSLTLFGTGTQPPAALSASAKPQFTGFALEVVPEPSTVALAALGVAGLFFVARRK